MVLRFAKARARNAGGSGATLDPGTIWDDGQPISTDGYGFIPLPINKEQAPCEEKQAGHLFLWRGFHLRS